MFSTAPGRVHEDADGPNSPLITELIKELGSPTQQSAETVFNSTRIGVSRATKAEQVPWVSSSLVEDFQFGRGAAMPVAAPPPSPPPPVSPQVQAQPGPPTPAPQKPAPPPPKPGPPVLASTTPAAEPEAGELVRDCPDCPELVVLPAGDFEMGANVTPFEKPEHRVTIPKPFAIGRREVTFDEWDACAATGACKHRPDDHGWGRGNRPVIDVSWDDAKLYVAWLSQLTGRKYRLPSEAEWEYAARGGTKSTFWWGGDTGNGNANCEDCGGPPRRQTVPTGSFRPNGFGLYDTAGNVAEWVEDCWNDNYRNAPRDGSAWATGQCRQRVLRGGSFGSRANVIRSAARFRYDQDVRYYANGFRVVRDLK
jgi:formylglycine-generating enzyme required for sulfatase activity